MGSNAAKPVSRAGGLVAFGGSLLVVASMFMPWVQRGSESVVDFWHLLGVEGLKGDRAVYELSLVLMLLLVAWCAVYFVWRTTENRLAWAFGGFAGAMMLYGSDVRISEDLPASSSGPGELAAAVGILLILAGFVYAIAVHIAESGRTGMPSAQHR